MLARSLRGPLLVGFAAFLWATDALFRYPAIDSVDPILIVLAEHILAVLILLPWMYFKYRENLFGFSAKEWFAAIFSGMLGSAIATVVFTASFFYVNPSVSILLQKLQPILVVLIAYLFLGERPNRRFFIWGLVALAAGIILSFPDLNFGFLNNRSMDVHSKGVQYAFGAAFIWAASTVTGKVLVKRTPPVLATFWRFVFGLIALIGLLVLTSEPIHWQSMTAPSMLVPLLYLSLVPGLFAMLFYYTGLSTTPASVATFIELLYPIGAVALNTLFLHTPLEAVQMAAAGVLLFAVAMISV